MTRPQAVAVARRVGTSRVSFFTLLAAVDGSVAVLAANGTLATVEGALLVGLTVIAGAGAWIAARDEYGGRRLDAHDVATLLLWGVLLAASTAAAAWAGERLGHALGDVTFLRLGVGAAMALIALEVSGVRLPRLGRLPLIPAVLGTSVLGEVARRWTP